MENVQKINFSSSEIKYLIFISENDGNCCEKCRNLNGKVFRGDDPAIPKLPLHPNCRCVLRMANLQEAQKAMETIKPAIPSFIGKGFDDVIIKVGKIYKYKVPKPPRNTNNKANWLLMTWMCFF